MPFFVSQKASNSRPPRWTTCVVWLEGFPSLLEAPLSRSLTATGPKRIAEAVGNWPLQASLCPPEVCVIYSVWEQIDPLLFERSTSRRPCHSLRLIRDLRRDFLCTHAHTYRHTVLIIVSALPLAFGRGIVLLWMCLSDSDFGWRAERGVLSFSLGINPLLMKHLLTTEAMREPSWAWGTEV